VRSIVWGVVAVAVAFGAGVALERWRVSHLHGAGDDHSETVGRYQGGVITALDVEQELSARGAGSAERYVTPEARRDLVTEIVRRRVLVEHARAARVDFEPETRLRLERALSEAFVERMVAPATQVADDELKAYLTAHAAEFDQPERFRVAYILLKALEGPERDKRRKEAAALLEQIRRASLKDFYAFDNAAREKSEDAATRPLGGELPPMTRDALVLRFGTTAADGLAALPRSGTLLDRPVETAEGLALIRLVAHTPALHAGFAELKAALKRRVIAEKKESASRALEAELDAEARLQIDDAALARVRPKKDAVKM